MVTYEIYTYDQEIEGYGEWVEGTTTQYGRATPRTLKKNTLMCLNRNKNLTTGKYVVAMLKGTEKQLDGDYWAFIVGDAIVDYNKEKQTLVIVDYIDYREER